LCYQYGRHRYLKQDLTIDLSEGGGGGGGAEEEEEEEEDEEEDLDDH
jgi:hypothetical protein